MSIDFLPLFVFTCNMQVYFSHFIWLWLALGMSILFVCLIVVYLIAVVDFIRSLW